MNAEFHTWKSGGAFDVYLRTNWQTVLLSCLWNQRKSVFSATVFNPLTGGHCWRCDVKWTENCFLPIPLSSNYFVGFSLMIIELICDRIIVCFCQLWAHGEPVYLFDSLTMSGNVYRMPVYCYQVSTYTAKYSRSAWESLSSWAYNCHRFSSITYFTWNVICVE